MLSVLVLILARLLLHREWVFVHSRIEELIGFLRLHPELAPPLVAQRLLVSGEDRRHARHSGFDILAICRAVFCRLTSGRREGASTIEQQIVRVLANRFEPTLRRKLHEILLASLIAADCPKSVTPSLYLAIGYYGWQMNDYTQACRRLRLQPYSLTLDDAAGVVARLKYPEPRVSPPMRVAQIAQRTRYLKQLYWTHVTDGTYDHLGVADYGSTVPGAGRPREAVGSIPCA